MSRSPVTAILGPRQCGKTTIARMLTAGFESHFFDLENPTDIARLQAPLLALKDLTGIVVIAEIQRKPELFEVLRVLADQATSDIRYLILGSASPHLVRGVSESLAGRIAFVDMGGFDLQEAGAEKFSQLWLRGGFPRSFLAREDGVSMSWRRDFVRTFVERDVPQLGYAIPSQTLQRFWSMVAHFHGQILNASELARSLGASESTARRYIDLLSGAFVVRQLPPWHENLGKRQVKSPKLYIRDSGLLHQILDIPDNQSLLGHPKVGASWEGFVVEQLHSMYGGHNFYFWATHSGAELDVLLTFKGKRYGFEMKLTDSPRTTKSMHIALDNLRLEHLFVVYPGDQSFPLHDTITALAAKNICGWTKIVQT